MQVAAPTRPPRRRPPKRPRFWLRRLVLLSILLLPFLAWRGWSYVKQDLLTVKAEGNAARVAVNEPVYIVLLGVDERKADVGRADTLLLVRLTKDRLGAHIMSIPRDTLITYSSGKQSKINAAYSIGGPELVTEVVTDLLSLPTKPYYVKLNLQAFEDVVDQLGGVDLLVDKHYQYEDPFQDLKIDIPAGQQHMDGKTALKFVRIRKDGVTDSDLGRIERQQQFMKAVQQKVLNPSYITKLPGLLSIAHQHVTTNIPESDQLTLGQEFFKARNNLRMEKLPGMPNDETGDWLLDSTALKEVTQAWSTN